MDNTVCLKWGKLFFATAIFAIGVIHLITGNFPTGLEPVPASLPERHFLVYLTGLALIIAGLLMVIKKYTRHGIILAGIVLGLLLLLLDLPLLQAHLHDPTPWTVTFEVVGLLSGLFLLFADKTPYYKLIGRNLLLLALVVFGIQHYLYAKFIATLIPTWMPLPLIWAWLVTIAFFAAALSLLLNIKVRLTAILLSLMFLLWVIILHLPRAITARHSEPEWTSLFVALAMGGVSLALAGSTNEKR